MARIRELLMVLWDHQHPRILSVNAYQDAEFSAEFYEIRARESVPAFKRYIECFSEFDFYMASTCRGQRNGPSHSPTPFYPPFTFCMAFSGYRLILSVRDVLNPHRTFPSHSSHL